MSSQNKTPTNALNIQLVNVGNKNVIDAHCKECRSNQSVSVCPSKIQEDVNQLWDFESTGDGKTFHIVSKVNTDFVLTVQQGEDKGVVLSERKTPPAIDQLWQWRDECLQSVATNAVLSLSNDQTKCCKLTAEVATNHPNQRWAQVKMLWDEVKSGWMPEKEATGRMPFITD